MPRSLLNINTKYLTAIRDRCTTTSTRKQTQQYTR